LKVLVLREVEVFFYHFWMLKVFVVSFECWRFLLILLDVEGSFFYFLMLKVITFTLGCLKFLLLLLDIEGFYFCWFYVIGLNFHYVSIHQHQNYVYKVRFFQKVLKIVIQFT
jgi:hypothetical protein